MNMFRSNGGGGSIFSNLPLVTKNLLIINGLCWLTTIVLGRMGIDLVRYLGLHYILADNFNAAQLVTYMFMHDTSSISHLFFNMFSLFMFGRTLEMVWGPKRFLTYYITTGIGAAIIQQLAWSYEYREILFGAYTSINTGVQILTTAEFMNRLVTVGASGAVFGILLAFGMLFPNAELYMMFIPIPIKAKYFVVFYGIVELFLGVRSAAGDNVAHFAHLGGMLFGLLLILHWRKTDRNNGHYY